MAEVTSRGRRGRRPSASLSSHRCAGMEDRLELSVFTCNLDFYDCSEHRSYPAVQLDGSDFRPDTPVLVL